MSFFRVSNPVATPWNLDDLGITIAASASNIVLSDQFTAQELVRSADLEQSIINGDLTVQIDYGTGYTSVSAGDYTNRDCLGAFLNIYEITNENNNEDLVDGSEVNSSGSGGNPLHIHDARYYTETELGNSTAGAPGGGLIGVDDTAWSSQFNFDDVQEFIDDFYTWLTSGAGLHDLDYVYTNDSDGIMNVNGTTKPLNLRSDDVNDIIISRFSTPDAQDALRFDVSADELLLGSAAVGGLAQIDVRVKTDLYVDGNITFVGTITDTTVDEMNVTNANITLREGAATGADASILVERGSTGTDASLLWDETADRWKAGLDGSENTIALLELDENVTGVWSFGGDDDTEPDMLLLEKDDATPPASNLGTADEIPIAMFPGGILGVYDKSNSRNKWLSVMREHMTFSGRNTKTNKNEYLWIDRVNSMQTGMRLLRDATLVGLSIESKDSDTYTLRIRKNNSATNLASLAVTGATGLQDITLNVDFSQGDEVQAYLESANNIEAPVARCEFAYRI
jgi:hypothetical protein